MHGAPVHLGRPELIGIEDLARPWVRSTRLPFCITHAPGHMLVTDLKI